MSLLVLWISIVSVVFTVVLVEGLIENRSMTGAAIIGGLFAVVAGGIIAIPMILWWLASSLAQAIGVGTLVVLALLVIWLLK
jgi:hypothetical protein